MMTDPTRLLDDPSIAASLRADLAQAKSAGLVGFDAAAGVASLQAAIAAEATTATATAASAGVSKGFVIGLIGVVSAGAIALVTLRSPEPEPLAAVVPPVTAVPIAAAEDSAPQDEPYEEDAEPLEPEALPEPEPEPEPVEAPVPPEPKVERPKAPESKVERPTDDYLREAKLIADARRALKRDPARALKILEEAETSFPRGLLREEREALTILSLDGLGRTAQAQSRGRQFIEAHGKSPYADAVRQVLH